MRCWHSKRRGCYKWLVEVEILVLEDDTKSITEYLQEEPLVRCCLYWVYNDKCSDLTTEGYIGITNNPHKRFQQHRNLESKNTGYLYRKNMPKADTRFKILLISDRDTCLNLEKTLRPERNIGWNTAIGGEASNLLHGLTGNYAFDAYRRFKRKARDQNIPFGWEDSPDKFVNWFSKINPDNKPTKLKVKKFRLY